MTDVVTVIAELASRLSPCPPDGWVTMHPAVIPVVYERDGHSLLGKVGHLERSEGRVMAILVAGPAAADVLSSEGDWFAKPMYRGLRHDILTDTSVTLYGVSIERERPSIGASPVCWSRHDLTRAAGGAPRGLPWRWHETWDHGHQLLASPPRRRGPTVLLDLARCETAAKLRAAPPRPPAPPPPRRHRRTHTEAALEAERLGVGGYSLTDEHGQTLYVRGGGHIVSFA